MCVVFMICTCCFAAFTVGHDRHSHLLEFVRAVNILHPSPSTDWQAFCCGSLQESIVVDGECTVVTGSDRKRWRKPRGSDVLAT